MGWCSLDRSVTMIAQWTAIGAHERPELGQMEECSISALDSESCDVGDGPNHGCDEPFERGWTVAVNIIVNNATS